MCGDSKTGRAAGMAGVVAVVGLASVAGGEVLPVDGYLSFDDSPFMGFVGSYFFLEDFEDGLLNAPGLSGVANTPGFGLNVGGGGNFTDSVDGDDGEIDGAGNGGFALAATPNANSEAQGYTFTFDADELGGLPTHVGYVWTDGGFNRVHTARFFDADGNLLGEVSAAVGDAFFTGGTAEDAFFGAIFEEGIASFTVFTASGVNNLTIDHIQYGLIPTPGAAGVLGAAGLLFGGRRRR